jgi:hypothetical protein
MRIIGLILFFIFIAGCSSFIDRGWAVDESRIQNYIIENPGDSKITFYRLAGHYRTKCDVKLFVDGDVIVKNLKEAENVTIYLPSGLHTFSGILCDRFDTALNVVISEGVPYNYAISVGKPGGFLIYDIGPSLNKESI